MWDSDPIHAVGLGRLGCEASAWTSTWCDLGHANTDALHLAFFGKYVVVLNEY